MRKFYLLALLACSVVALVLMVASPSEAVHKGAGSLVCGSCHTMHNSQSDATMGGASGGSIVLLRANITGRAEIHKFCLTCHAEDGTNAATLYGGVTPPKVLRSTSATDAEITVDGNVLIDHSQIGAGGDFSYNAAGEMGLSPYNALVPGAGDGFGHGLGQTAIDPPGTAEAAITEFSCTNCHDPHGTSADTADIFVYRNLKVKPVGGGGASAADAQVMTTLGAATDSYVGGVDGTNFAGANSGVANHFWPVFNSDILQNVYDAPLDATPRSLTSGFSAWCAQCHDDWHQESLDQSGTNQSGSDWLRHPVDNPIVDATPNSGGGMAIADFAHYSSSTDKDSAPTTTETAATILPAAQGAAAGTVYYADDSGDHVFCLSCHFAHAGPYEDALRWDHAPAGAAAAVATPVGCEQCHNK